MKAKKAYNGSKNLKNFTGIPNTAIASNIPRSVIVYCVQTFNSARAIGRYLGILQNTVIKYCKMYKWNNSKTCFDYLMTKEKSEHIEYYNLGIYMPLTDRLKREEERLENLDRNINKKLIPLKRIFANKNLNYPLDKLKDRLISEQYFPEICMQCGYNQRREIDFKVPLNLAFIDGNPKNMSDDNLMLICNNCYHIHIGDMRPDIYKTIKRLIKKELL